MSADIPVATILRLNAERTIPIERYEADGFFDRFGYLRDLAEEHGLDFDEMIEVVDLLGPEEDFDGLVTTLEDGADGYGFAAILFGGEAGA